MKLMTKKKHNRKGFTLIELIVVLAILGILAAIAVPNFTAIQEDAKLKADTSTANSILKAARLQHFSSGLADNESLVLNSKPKLSKDYFDSSDVQVQSASNDTYYLMSYTKDSSTKYAVLWTTTDPFAFGGNPTITKDKGYIVKEETNERTLINVAVTDVATNTFTFDSTKYTILQLLAKE